MFKKFYVPLILLCMLVVACEENGQSPPNNDPNLIPVKEVDQHALASEWYQNLSIPSEDFYTEKIDFDGDGIPELFIGYNGPNYGYIIGKYNPKKSVWEEWSAAHYETPTYGAIHFKDCLIGKDNKAIALITNVAESASNALEVLHLLKVSEDGEKIISGKAYRLYDDNELIVDKTANSFTIQTENDAEHFTIMDHVISSEYRTANLYSGYPILQNEELKKLLDHKFFTTNITFEDTYEIAQLKAGKPDKEEYYEGGFCAFYTDFSFCLGEEGVPVENYMLSNFMNISKTAFEKAINQKILISSYERYGNPDDVIYYAIFEVDHVYFHAEFSNGQDNAKLTKLTVSLNKLDS